MSEREQDQMHQLLSQAMVALVGSIWAMREVATEWTIIVGFVVVPICVVAVVFRRHLRLAVRHAG